MSYKRDEAIFMAHSLRIEYPVDYCHFTNRSHSRGNIFLDNKRRKRVFRLAFRQLAAREDGQSMLGRN